VNEKACLNDVIIASGVAETMKQSSGTGTQILTDFIKVD
jgi:hypothetical protein